MLLEVYVRPVFLQSDYAREHAQALAAAASLGWVSSLNLKTKSFGRVWLITPEGMIAMSNRDHYQLLSE